MDPGAREEGVRLQYIVQNVFIEKNNKTKTELSYVGPTGRSQNRQKKPSQGVYNPGCRQPSRQAGTKDNPANQE